MKFNIKKIFEKEVSYHNATLSDLLGLDYKKILEYGLGRNWGYHDFDKMFHNRVNIVLDTNFTKEESIDQILLQVKALYNDKDTKENISI